jgi:hypothetical protein
MSHKITERDRQVGIKQAWHGLTHVVDNIDVEDNYLTSWDIKRAPLKIVLPSSDVVETGYDILVATDDGLPIGRPVGKIYQPITNEMFLDMVRDALDRLPSAKIESIGSVCNRGRVFVSISLEGHKQFKIGHREFNDFLNLGNSHDQSSKMWMNNTNCCTVCNNTFSYNLNSTDNVIGSVVHKGDVELKMADLSEIANLFLGTQEDFRIKFTNLIKKSIDADKASRLFAGFLDRNNPVQGVSERTVLKLTSLFKDGNGNRGESYADAFSAVTDYYTHSSTKGGGQNISRQYVSSEFGPGRINKQVFWNIINDEDLVERTINRGEKVLNLINTK